MKLNEKLNPAQKQAVEYTRGPLLILAGAGSGKTRVITFRIANLIKNLGIPPRRILALTFTNKAAEEMRNRIEQLVARCRGLWMSTFHAFGARILRSYADLLGRSKDFVIYDTNCAKRLGKDVLHELDLDPHQFPVEHMLKAVERAKRSLQGAEFQGLYGNAQAFYRVYQKHLYNANAFDFSDLIYQTNHLFDQHPDVLEFYQRQFEYVLVDEFQDTDQAQYRLLRLLCPPDTRVSLETSSSACTGNLCVVGDDDQSIYTWRGADVSNILNFKEQYPQAHVIKLEKNYRSTANVLGVASAVIACNHTRTKKHLWTDAELGEPVRAVCLQNEHKEAEWVAQCIEHGLTHGIPLSHTAIFYRINAQSRAIEEALRVFGIPYRVIGGTRFFDRAEIRDLMAYLRLALNPRSDLDLLRVFNTPPRGLGEKTRVFLVEQANQHGCSLWDIIKSGNIDGLRKAEQIKLLGFQKIMEEFIHKAECTRAVDMIEYVIARTGYVRALDTHAKDEARTQQENLDELQTAAKDLSKRTNDTSLRAFVEHVALMTDIDSAWASTKLSIHKQGKGEAVFLMTLHAAKGLEFDQVFMVGMEDGLLPYRRALSHKDDEYQRDRYYQNRIEEERRLCYVGMTRAKQRLMLTFVRSRSIFGHTEFNPLSRFLTESSGLILEDKTTSQTKIHNTKIINNGYKIPNSLLQQSSRNANHTSDQKERIDYGYEYNQQVDRYSQRKVAHEWLGHEVEHASFGRGQVCSAQTSSCGVVKLVVNFYSKGRKTVLANYVKQI